MCVAFPTEPKNWITAFEFSGHFASNSYLIEPHERVKDQSMQFNLVCWIFINVDWLTEGFFRITNLKSIFS